MRNLETHPKMAGIFRTKGISSPFILINIKYENFYPCCRPALFVWSNAFAMPGWRYYFNFPSSGKRLCAVQVVCETLQANPAYVNISGNATGCQNNQEVLEACLTPVSPELEVLPACVLFPNPVHHALHVFVNVPNQEVTIWIRDISGRVWMQNTFFRNQQVDLSFLNAGIYFVEIEVTGYRTTRKIVKI